METKMYLNTETFPELAYLKTGVGPALILLHGFPESGSLWRNIWPSMAASFTVIIPDIPGSGESTFTGEQITMEQLATGIKQVMDKENIQEAVLVGHSMGGYIAFAFADLYPAYVKGLSLVHSTAGADDEEKKETRRKSIRLIQKGGKEAFIEQMIPNLFSAVFKENRPGDLAKEIQRGLELDGRSMVAFYNAMINRPARTSILDKAEFPVQWVIGKDDNVIPAGKVLRQTTVADVNFIELYADCAHMSMLEQPEKLIEDMTEFGKYCYDMKN